MELGAILLLLALIAGVGFFLAAPLMRRADPSRSDESSEVSGLLAERDRVITALQELDFDFNLGKVPEDAYPEQRTALLQHGAQILRRLDEIAPASAEFGSRTADASVRIEEAASGTAAPLPDDKIESMLSARRASRRARSAGFCPKCGKPVLTSDRFCPNCGRSLK